MTTLFDAACLSHHCEIPVRSSIGPVSPEVPLLTEGSSNSSTALRSSTSDDYEEDASVALCCSPGSVRTVTKESSPGSTELPSMPSENSASRGCSGDGSTSCLITFEMTDIERSASDGSLSPCIQRSEAEDEVMCPISMCPAEPMFNLIDHKERIGTGSVLPAKCITSPSKLHLTHGTSTAFTPPYCCSTPITDHLSYGRAINGSSNSHAIQSVIAPPRSDVISCHFSTHSVTHSTPSLVTNFRIQPPFFTNNGSKDTYPFRCISTASFSLKNADFPFADQNPHYSRTYEKTTWIGETHSPTITTSCRLHASLSKGGCLSQSLSHSFPGSQRPQYQPDSLSSQCCDPSVKCDTVVHSSTLAQPTVNTFSINPHPSRQLPSVHNPHYFNRNSIWSTTDGTPRIGTSNAAHSINPEFSSNADCVLPWASANSPLPLLDRQIKLWNKIDHPVNDRALQTTSATTKRRSQCITSQRSSKKQRLVDWRSTSTSTSSFSTSHSRLLMTDPQQCLHDPIVSLPKTLIPPKPIPVHSHFAKLEHLLPNTPTDGTSTPLRYTRLGKYSTFPMFPNKPRNSVPNDSHIGDFLLGCTEDQTPFYKFLRDNLLCVCLRQASSRTSQSCTSSSPPTPAPQVSLPDELLNHFSVVRDDGRTTPPLLLTHKCTVSSMHRGLNSHTYNIKSDHPTDFLTSELLVCAHCAVQLLAREHVLSLKVPDWDERLSFCSFGCLTAYHDSVATKDSKVSSLSYLTPSILDVKPLLSDSGSSLVILLRRPFPAKCLQPLSKRSSHQNKFSRRRSLLESTNHLRGMWNGRQVTRCWHSIRWKRFSKSAFCMRMRAFLGSLLPDSPNNPTSSFRNPSSSSAGFVPQTDSNSTLRVNSGPVDRRVCLLCQKTGDAPNEVSGRLLHYDYNMWLHLNCILWCYDTYETVSGSLVQVSRALKKAEQTVCTGCGSTGAGLPCFFSDCQAIYHLPCAHSIGCSFYADRGMYCPLHKEEANKLCQLHSLSVERRVFINRDEGSQVADVILQVNQQNEPSIHLPSEDSSVKLRVGGLILHSVGQLLSEHLCNNSFHSVDFIYPVGYSSTRIYWSYRHVRRRCLYHCRIEDSLCKNDDPLLSLSICPKFIVQVDERNESPEVFMDSSCDGVWQQILRRINETRRSSGLSHLRIIQNRLRGEVLFGLTEPHIVRAIESLPGVDRLSAYIFKFGRLQLFREMPLALNPTGCARSEPKMRTHVRRKHNSDAPQHNLLRNASIANPVFTPAQPGLSSPVYSVSPPFVSISKSQQYKRLRLEWRHNVVLARSRIQGLGLYAARDINSHAFIIEYLGELIRNEVGNRRERLYESQNRGIYMFRVDDDSIVDATMCGGLARYINHSCEPNCTAEVLNCENGSHIIIIASRNIEKGEELTYDYKFDIEEERGDRIPCLCGASNCRKWMN